MSRTLEQREIAEMTVFERLELIGDLWDSISDTSPSPDVPDWHQKEIQRRCATADAEPDTGRSWDEIRIRLLKS